MYTESSPYLELPPLSQYEQTLASYWWACGLSEQTSAGLKQLSWSEIIKWAYHFHKRTDIEIVEHPRPDKRFKASYSAVTIEWCALANWEIEQIHKMSEIYVGEYSAASSDERRACPTQIDQDSLDDEAKLANARAIEEGFKMWAQQANTAEVVPNK